MISFLTIVFIISAVGIWYFIKKKPNKKYRNVSIIITAISALVIGFITPTSTNNKSTNDSNSTKMVTQKKKISLGMTQDEVIKNKGKKPDYKNDRQLMYGDTHYYFENGKLVGGDTKDLMKQAKNREDKKEKAEADKRDKVIAFAQSFGRKPTDSIAKNPTAYKTTTSGDTTMYSWNSGYGLMIRVDSPDRMTKVYMADDSKDNGLGELLYTGRTIYQKTTHVIY